MATAFNTSCSRGSDKCRCGLYAARCKGTKGQAQLYHRSQKNLNLIMATPPVNILEEVLQISPTRCTILLNIFGKRNKYIKQNCAPSWTCLQRFSTKFQILVVNRYSKPTTYSEAKIFQVISQSLQRFSTHFGCYRRVQ